MTDPEATERARVSDETLREVRHVALEQEGWRRDALLTLLADRDSLAASLRAAEEERDAALEALRVGWSRDNMKERAEKAEARLQLVEEALREIEKARPTRGVPLKDTLEGCNHIARVALKSIEEPK